MNWSAVYAIIAFPVSASILAHCFAIRNSRRAAIAALHLAWALMIMWYGSSFQ